MTCIHVKQILGLPADAKPLFSIQLSSPIEIKKITCISDPLDTKKEGSFAEFLDVDTSVATFQITAYDEDVLLGASAFFDVSPLCDGKSKSNELDVAFVPVAQDTSVGNNTAQGGEASVSLLEPVCTAVFRVEYEPSMSDQKQELFELKSQNTSRREATIDKLRKCAAALNRIKSSSGKSSEGSSKDTAKSPAVKSGFLTKKEKKQPFFLVRWYKKTLGPDSLVRQLFPIFKNYFIFFGAVALMHFQGQQLALPPPV